MVNLLTSEETTKDLKSLGNNAKYETKEPSIELLETFKAPDGECTVEFCTEHNEGTSLCPITNQPDYFTFKLLYRPKERCVESKSLKIYIQSFRNSAGFGESLTNRWADDLFEKLQPIWLVVVGDFSPRGGLRWITRAHRVSEAVLQDDSTLDMQQMLNYR